MAESAQTADRTSEVADRLVATIKAYESCAVAFSAGVDSTVVAMAARLALGGRAIAVTGVGPALAEGELEQAKALAEQIGIEHVATETDEIHQAGYVANAADRCFHCKTELYGHVERIARERGIATIANGANVDDRGDHRPGMQAAADYSVRSPLIECNLTKADVRALAAHWDLPVADKPAAPCLASRVAYGVEVTPERLRRIDLAEQHLRSLGLREVRVRLHAGGVARLEVPAEALPKLVDEAVRKSIVNRLTELGFAYITLDLTGLRSGSMNDVVPLELLVKQDAE